jgi:hypothetical protein
LALLVAVDAERHAAAPSQERAERERSISRDGREKSCSRYGRAIGLDISADFRLLQEA